MYTYNRGDTKTQGGDVYSVLGYAIYQYGFCCIGMKKVFKGDRFKLIL